MVPGTHRSRAVVLQCPCNLGGHGLLSLGSGLCVWKYYVFFQRARACYLIFAEMAMTTALSIPRKSYADFDHLNEIAKYCADMFGVSVVSETWSVNFSEESDDYATFTFYDDELATVVKLRFPDMLTPDEFEDQLWGYNLPLN